MTGGHLRNFRFGARTELLAECALNTIAFTTRVPRQEDIGHDFVCALAELRGNMHWAGPTFTVQVKSNRNPLVFEKSHEIEWIREQENPYFVAVGNREKLELEIYSTWIRLRGFLAKRAKKIVFKFLPAPEGEQSVQTEADCSQQVIYLGNPVVTCRLDKMMNEDHASKIGQVLRDWVLVDQQNIVNRRADMHLLTGPVEYETNTPFGPERIAWIFWNAKNLQKCELNCVRAATQLRLTLDAAGGEVRGSDLGMERVAALDAVLRAYAQCLEPHLRKALADHPGLQFDSDSMTR